MMPKIQLYQN